MVAPRGETQSLLRVTVFKLHHCSRWSILDWHQRCCHRGTEGGCRARNPSSTMVGFYGFHQQDDQLFGVVFNDGSNPNLSTREHPSGNTLAVFVQDRASVTSWLTLTFGVRQTRALNLLFAQLQRADATHDIFPATRTLALCACAWPDLRVLPNDPTPAFARVGLRTPVTKASALTGAGHRA